MSQTTATNANRTTLRIALVANLAMFGIGIAGWIFAQSTGLLADAFDMLADASSYTVALMAVGRSTGFQENAARWNGAMLIILGVGVIGEVIHRWISGSEPLGFLIMAFSLLSLTVNGAVLTMLSKYRNTEKVYLRAAWRDTRADVWVNISVLVSGAAVVVTGYRYMDLIAGFAISVYVIHEGIEIWREADSAAD